MIIEYPYAQRYLFTALRSGPEIIEKLLVGLTLPEADFRPEPERFTIREVIAHLAEWEPIFLSRMTRICDEDVPTMEGYDEGELAIQNDYAHKDPMEQLALFKAGREKMVTYLTSRTPQQWQRTGNRPEIGKITLEGLSLLIPLHDIYHIQQITDYRQKWLEKKE
jgi:hypothetical protein